MNCKQIFDHYYRLMSDEMREDIERYESLSKDAPLSSCAVRKGAVKVIYKDESWIRVYRNWHSGGIEWY